MSIGVKYRNLAGAAVLLALVLPAAASAQFAPRPDIRSHVGAFLPEEASALEAAPFVGMRVGYQLTPAVDVALNVNGSRMMTRERFFRPAFLDFGARAELYDVRQEVTAIQYGAEVGLGFDAGESLRPYVAAGAGGYALFLDPQANQGVANVSGVQATGAVGARWRLGERSGVSLELRDYMYFDYDQAALNPVDLEKQDVIFYERWPTPVEEKDRVNAFMVSLGFTYLP